MSKIVTSEKSIRRHTMSKIVTSEKSIRKAFEEWVEASKTLSIDELKNTNAKEYSEEVSDYFIELLIKYEENE